MAFKPGGYSAPSRKPNAAWAGSHGEFGDFFGQPFKPTRGQDSEFGALFKKSLSELRAANQMEQVLKRPLQKIGPVVPLVWTGVYNMAGWTQNEVDNCGGGGARKKYYFQCNRDNRPGFGPIAESEPQDQTVAFWRPNPALNTGPDWDFWTRGPRYIKTDPLVGLPEPVWVAPDAEKPGVGTDVHRWESYAFEEDPNRRRRRTSLRYLWWLHRVQEEVTGEESSSGGVRPGSVFSWQWYPKTEFIHEHVGNGGGGVNIPGPGTKERKVRMSAPRWFSMLLATSEFDDFVDCFYKQMKGEVKADGKFHYGVADGANTRPGDHRSPAHRAAAVYREFQNFSAAQLLAAVKCLVLTNLQDTVIGKLSKREQRDRLRLFEAWGFESTFYNSRKDAWIGRQV